MSALSSVSLSAIDPSLTSSAVPPINAVNEPAVIRNGTPAAKQAYQEALGFEQVLVNQLSQELASTVSSPSSSSDDSSNGSSSDSSGGMLGSDPSSSAFSSLIPQALTSGIMSSGGLGIATKLAEALDPSILTAQSGSSSSGSSSSGSSSSGSSSPAGQAQSSSVADPSTPAIGA